MFATFHIALNGRVGSSPRRQNICGAMRLRNGCRAMTVPPPLRCDSSGSARPLWPLPWRFPEIRFVDGVRENRLLGHRIHPATVSAAIVSPAVVVAPILVQTFSHRRRFTCVATRGPFNSIALASEAKIPSPLIGSLQHCAPDSMRAGGTSGLTVSSLSRPDPSRDHSG
jgi:hypothetical protein